MSTKISETSLVPLGLVISALSFIVASVMWAANIEAKAESALSHQARYELQVDRRLERIEAKLDKLIEDSK